MYQKKKEILHPSDFKLEKFVALIRKAIFKSIKLNGSNRMVIKLPSLISSV